MIIESMSLSEKKCNFIIIRQYILHKHRYQTNDTCEEMQTCFFSTTLLLAYSDL